MMEPSSSQFNEEQLIKDLKALAADAEALLMATANTSGDKLAEIRTKAEASLRAAKVTMADAQVDVLAKAKEAATATNHFVQENPWRSVGLAASIGVIVGLLLGRR
jgi:ElaB/YqjD/DUF883 family membrane-anchored ribosome-binding protein